MLEFIIYGLIHEGDWDLTQPQATLLAGVISGVLLIGAAYIAFHGQRAQRGEENRRHSELLQAQRDQFEDQLAAQRTQWQTTVHEETLRAERAELKESYARMSTLITSVHVTIIEIYTASEFEQRERWETLKLKLGDLILQYQSAVGGISIIGNEKLVEPLNKLMADTGRWSQGAEYGDGLVESDVFQVELLKLSLQERSILAMMRADIENHRLEMDTLPTKPE